MERPWTDDKERLLLAFYSEHSCLWNHKSKSYKNRVLRWKMLEQIRIVVSEQPPAVPYTVEDVKSKFKNLRTTFQRHYKVAMARRASRSGVLASRWKHFQQMTFLENSWESEEASDDPDPQSPPLPLEETPKPEIRPASPCIVSFLPAAETPIHPSTPPDTVTEKGYWTEENEGAVIWFFSEHRCLWDKRCENHNNRHLRQKMLETLRSELAEHHASFSVEEIKSKWKNLRTVFHRKYKAVMASKTSGSSKVYVPKWKHYRQMLFLQEVFDEDGDPEDALNGAVRDEPGLKYKITLPTLPPMSLVSSLTGPSAAPTSGSTGAPQSRDSAWASGECDTWPSGSPRGFGSGNRDNAASALNDAWSASPPAPDAELRTGGSRKLSIPALRSSRRKPGRPSSKPGAKAHHWTDAKVRELIAFYSDHSCLWNSKSKEYHDPQLRRSTMERLKRLLSKNHPVQFTVEGIRSKFQMLRAAFQREHQAVSSNRTCGSEDFYVPRWEFYHQMMFLCDSYDDEDAAGPLQASEVPDPSAFDPASSGGLEPRPPSCPTPPASLRSSPSTGSGGDAGQPWQVPLEESPTGSGADVLDLVRNFCQNPVASPHSGFLRYVEECLNDLPPGKVKRMKMKIIETIHSVSEDT